MPESFDVAIIGGGPAGIAAALAAAKKKARVLLVEASERLGGVVTGAMHRCMCGLYADRPAGPTDTLNDGPQRELIQRLARLAPAAVICKPLGKTWVLEFPTVAWETAIESSLREADVVLRTGKRATAFTQKSKLIDRLFFEDGESIDVKAVIDCTGAGNVIGMFGDEAATTPDPKRMLGGYAIRVTGLTGDPDMTRLQVVYTLRNASDRGDLPPLARFTMFHPGPGTGEGICKLAAKVDDTTPVARLADEVFAYLKKNLDGFSAATIVDRSTHLLPRDGRRLRGLATLTEDDVLGSREFDASAVRAWWPIETWSEEEGPSYAYPAAGRPYQIPIRTMICRSVDNLFAAGACLSATANAIASARVSGICLATGAKVGDFAATLLTQASSACH